jgi:beta-phosphoglucomutase-like phosphatase (HAD superfamily)
VPRALARWRAQGHDVAIFSSGSVLAQKLLFSRSGAGDLTAFMCAYFDTTTGAKGDVESYRKMAGALGQAPPKVPFVSDVTAELDAACTAGMATLLCVRARDAPSSSGDPVVRSFHEVLSARGLSVPGPAIPEAELRRKPRALFQHPPIVLSVQCANLEFGRSACAKHNLSVGGWLHSLSRRPGC